MSDFKKKISREGYDYYSILGFQDLSMKDRKALDIKDIKRAFKKKLKKYHPDRLRGQKLSKKELQRKSAMYNLVLEAGDCLQDKNRKRAYDLEFEASRSSGLVNQRNQFNEFIKMQESTMSEEGRAMAQLEFEKGKADFLKKIGAESFEDEDPMDEDEMMRRKIDLETVRELEKDELECAQPRMFKEGEFNNKAFAKAFEKERLKRERRRGGGEIRTYNDIGAFNDNGGFGVGVNDDYGDLFTENRFNGNDKFTGVDLEEEDLDDLESVDSDEIDMSKFEADTAMDVDDLEAKIKEMAKEREKDLNISYKDQKSAMEDKFGISKQMGFMVGTDFNGIQIKRRTEDQLDDNKVSAYAKMIGYEENEDDQLDKDLDAELDKKMEKELDEELERELDKKSERSERSERRSERRSRRSGKSERSSRSERHSSSRRSSDKSHRRHRRRHRDRDRDDHD